MARLFKCITALWCLHTLLSVFAGASLIDKISHENQFTALDSEEPGLNFVNGTEDYRITRKGKDNKSWYDGREMKLVYCLQKAWCEALKNNTCLGVKLPYTETSLHLTYSNSQEQVAEKLQQYLPLRNIPKCWAVIQPFLCATFMPKCENIQGREMVFLPSIEMCKLTMEPCKLVYDTLFFPEFLKCSANRFPSKCDNDVREMKFNTSAQCLPPLVHTDIASHFYDGISGCGLPCLDPLYTEDEHHQIKRLIFWGASVSFVLNFFTAATFLVDWRSSSKYPALVIFYVNVCYMLSSIGWLSQFIFDSGSDIVCSKDGTRRLGEPSAGENLSCVIVFVLVYYFLMAACVWFVIFTYAWHMSFKGLGKIQERIDKKGAYFHLVAWSLPLVLTITVMALSEVDGSSITGICFVGYLNHPMRAGLLLGPIAAVLLIGGYFLSRSLLTLTSVRTSSKDIISARASSKIRQTIMRCAVTAILIVLFIFATFVCHIYEFRNSSNWNESFRQWLVCRLLGGGWCVQASRPSVAMLQLQLLCLFCSATLMASWTWTAATIHTWKRYFRRKCGCEIEEPVKLQKHKLIAQAFARRKEFHDQGRMSISFHNTHTDPVGLNFELNSVASHDFSSTWANNLPRFVKRRGALTGAQHSHSQSSNAPRRNSQDSQISFSLRHVSVESRRNSLDSQLSVKIAQMNTKVATRRRMKLHSKTSRRRPQRNTTVYTRKESTTSVESQIGNHILKALSSTKERHASVPVSSNRRTGNAGLSQEQVDLLLANGRMILPFLQNQGLTTTSDEENGSMASFKVRDSQLNIVLRQKDLNISTDDIAVNNSMNIREYQTDSDEEVVGKELVPAKKYRDLDPISSDDIRVARNSGRRELYKDLHGSKSSSKSKSSRRSSRQSGRVKIKSKRPLKGAKTMKCKEENFRMSTFSRKKNCENVPEGNAFNLKSSPGSSLDSYCSELGPLALQSSFSGVSAGKNNSRNSKTSCDVGIQANSHEIATQTLSSYEGDPVKKNKLNLNKNSLSFNKGAVRNVNIMDNVRSLLRNDSAITDVPKSSEFSRSLGKKPKSRKEESNEPLLKSKRSSDQPVIVKRNDNSCNISESKKLKQLLLP